MLNDDDGSANLMCAKCKRRVESLETAMMNLTKFKRSVAVLQSEHHYSIQTSMLHRVRTLMSYNAEESDNSPESPHLGEIKRMSKQCVLGAPLFFARAVPLISVYQTWLHLTQKPELLVYNQVLSYNNDLILQAPTYAHTYSHANHTHACTKTFTFTHSHAYTFTSIYHFQNQ